MIPRAIQPLEIEYEKKFPNSKATLFFDELEPSKWLNLLKKAIENDKPLTKEDLIKYFGKEEFEHEIEYLSEWYDMSPEEILKGL